MSYGHAMSALELSRAREVVLEAGELTARRILPNTELDTVENRGAVREQAWRKALAFGVWPSGEERFFVQPLGRDRDSSRLCLTIGVRAVFAVKEDV